jgi:ABC-type sulfate/molybdate transport systems ATPase subunit
MLALQNELTAATILVTHDPTEAAMLADEILVFESGRVLQSGPTDHVFRRPSSETVARLLGAEHAATGVAASADSINVGGGAFLDVTGAILTANAHIGWSVAPSRVRMSDVGRYCGDRSRHPGGLGVSGQHPVRRRPDRCGGRICRTAARCVVPLRH